MLAIIYNYLTQILLGFGPIVGLTLILYLCSKYFISKTGNFGLNFTRITGVIGTPIHEFSHMLMCLIFGHKITEIKLFQISNDGVLGYVNHSYNPKNFYHRIGNFFIGIAPIFGATALIYLVLYFGLPNLYETIASELDFVYSLNIDLLDAHFYQGLFEVGKSIFLEIFDWYNFSNFVWWLCMLVILCITMHMLISTSDIKSALDGLAFVLIILLFVNIIGHFFHFLNSITYFIISVISILLPILCVSLCVSFAQILTAEIYKKIKNRRKKL